MKAEWVKQDGIQAGAACSDIVNWIQVSDIQARVYRESQCLAACLEDPRVRLLDSQDLRIEDELDVLPHAGDVESPFHPTVSV